MIELKGARALTALARQAGLPMRMALSLQSDLAFIPPKDQLQPRDGVDYPLTDEECSWHLDYFKSAQQT